MLKGLLAVTAAAALLGLSDRVRVASFDHQQATARYRDIYYLPPTAWLKVGSLGYEEALASFIWMGALVNFGEELGRSGKVKYFFNYADAILALDPDFKRVYSWTAMVAMYRPVPATKDEALRAVTYLERAHERFPTDGELAWDLAAFYAYELPPLLEGDPEAAATAKRKAADYMRVAAVMGGGPAWIGLTAARRLDELGKSEQAVRHLLELYGTVQDPETKAMLEERIRRLRTENFVLAMQAANTELQRRRQQEYPYLDETLYLLVGERTRAAHRAFLIRGFDPVLEDAFDVQEADPVVEPVRPADP